MNQLTVQWINLVLNNASTKINYYSMHYIDIGLSQTDVN